MAMEANGKRQYKVEYIEKGRNWQRKIQVMQSSNGKLQRKQSDASIAFDSSVPQSGEQLVEMLMSPKNANSFLSTDGWLSKRDIFVIAVSHFLLRLIPFLAEEIALALN